MYCKMRNNQFLSGVIIISVNLYDDSLLQKLKYWTEKTEVTVFNVDDSRRLVEVISDKTYDKPLKLPIIAIRRSDGFTIKNPNKKPLTFDGIHFKDKGFIEYDSLKIKYLNNEISLPEYLKQISKFKEISNDDKIASLNAIPISIPYKIDVYTRYQKENDLYIRNLIFNFVNYPTMQIAFRYNGIDMQQNSNIILDPNISMENPTIKLFSDQVVKQSLSITIDDAYLWDIRIRNTVSIDAGGLTLAIKDKDNDFIIEQIS